MQKIQMMLMVLGTYLLAGVSLFVLIIFHYLVHAMCCKLSSSMIGTRHTIVILNFFLKDTTFKKGILVLSLHYTLVLGQGKTEVS